MALTTDGRTSCEVVAGLIFDVLAGTALTQNKSTESLIKKTK